MVTLSTELEILLIALPNATLPSGIIFTGTTLLGEVISIVAFIVLGTISTSIIIPFLSYATNSILSGSLNSIVPTEGFSILFTSINAFTVAT